ncbi:MAG TPA: S41 family peptidase [Gemmatimonadaceae bacterium]|nr:S41 family peptidase [Gemmatimonadaceae bacterium]
MRSRTITVLAVLGAALVSGGWLLHSGLGNRPGPADGARLFDSVLQHIDRYYVDSVPEPALYQKAVDGMLYELHDPHTVFLTPERLGRLTESTTGTYAGLGIQIDVRDGWITVIAPLPGTPADRAGIQTGDRIVEINGKTTKGLTGDEATKSLRGAPGSTVDLVVERPGVEARMPFKLQRQQIHTHSVNRVTMLRPGTGYLDVNVFGDSTAAEVATAVDSLTRQGMTSLILDLRGNPGGLLDQGVGVADLFLNPGQEIVSMRGRASGDRRAYTDRAPQRWPHLSLVVLVNEGSASASEIVAGALQDHDRAVIVGRTSYGKGSAQSVFPMTNGGALKVTTALWFTPSGRSINKRPINVNVSDDAEDEGGTDDTPATAADSAARRKALTFRTDADRAVYGGGGITPDVQVGDTALAPAELAFQRALGRKLPQFRDALTDYALSVRASHAVSAPDFTVTPAMRGELWARMQRRGIVMGRATYDSASSLVDRLLGYEVTRYAFGPAAEFTRVAAHDEVIAAALDLISGARTEADLLRRAAARQATVDGHSTASAPPAGAEGPGGTRR